jgi:hypothetical protein
MFTRVMGDHDARFYHSFPRFSHCGIDIIVPWHYNKHT